MSLPRKHAHDVIIRPIVTEKSYRLEDQGKYVFEVATSATKPQIKAAIEEIFAVKVASVNTINRKGKTQRTRTGMGKRKDTKRAIVSLREGTIEIYGEIG